MRSGRTLLIGIAVTALVATGCEWNFETLDGQSNGPNGRINAGVGTFGSSVIYNGRPHVFYRDDTAGDLRHGYYNGSFWAFETLDGSGGGNGRVNWDVAWTTSVVLYNGRPHVFYWDSTKGDLRHAYYNGAAWAFETLDGNGGANGRLDANVGIFSEALLYNGRPHVFYYTNTAGDLRHAYYNGFTWIFETLDGDGGANGRVDAAVGEYSAALLYNGRPHVFYRNDSNKQLRHAYYNGSAWGFETLDGNGGSNGRTNGAVGTFNAVVLYNGRPHAFYYDTSDADLRHAYWNGVFWAFETLDGAGGPGGRLDTDLGSYNAAGLYGGRPQVFYYKETGAELRHASYNGSAWVFETLDGNGGSNGRTTNSVGLHNTLVLYNGQPHVFYWDAPGGDLRHGWFG